MALFKRFEFWLAVIFLIAILLFALIGSRCSSSSDSSTDNGDENDPKAIPESTTENGSTTTSTKAEGTTAPDGPEAKTDVEAEPKPKAEAEPVPESEGPIRVRDLVLVRDYGNARLLVTAEIENASKEELVLLAPALELVGAEGKKIPAYILATQKPQALAAGETKVVTLPFWLEESHLAGSIEIRLGEDVVEIKGANPFALEDLENGVETSLTWPDWKTN